MKKFLLSLFFIVTSLTMVCAKDIIVQDYEALPQKGKEFITKYFANEQFSYMKIDDDTFKKDYEVYFKNGAKIEFNDKGEWKEVTSKKVPIPAGIVPNAITSYVNANYSQNRIIEIQKKSYGYEIELYSKVDLIFDKGGKFKRIDH